MTDITIIILTKNEEANIRQCICAVQELADRIVVVDSGSTDQTVSIAKELGAEVFYHPFEHYAAQFNWALMHVAPKTTWVYRLDADEVVPPELKEEILTECRIHKNDDVNGFLMKHKLLFLGRYLKYGGSYPFIKMTVFKPLFATFDDRAMGEHVVLSQGRYLTFKNDCLHHDCKDITAFIDKHNQYASRELRDYLDRKTLQSAQEMLYRKAANTQHLRDRIYYKLPMFVRAKLYYWYRYYIQLGFLDGTPGRVYAFMQAYFYRYLVDAKIYEYQTRISGENK